MRFYTKIIELYTKCGTGSIPSWGDISTSVQDRCPLNAELAPSSLAVKDLYARNDLV